MHKIGKLMGGDQRLLRHPVQWPRNKEVFG